MSESGMILKHFLCLEVMGLETDEVNELMAPKHGEKHLNRYRECLAWHVAVDERSLLVNEWT